MFRFFRFVVLVSLIALSVIACDDKKIGQDIITDIMTDDGNTTTAIAICNIGDILMTGQSCSDPNSDAVFTVLADGIGSYTSLSGILFEATDLLDTEGTSLNGVVYSFRASKLENGAWEILSPKSNTTEPNDTN